MRKISSKEVLALFSLLLILILTTRNEDFYVAFVRDRTDSKMSKHQLREHTIKEEPEDTSSEPKKSLRILCFGDSLTAGFTMRGMHFAPYSSFLEELLEEDGENRVAITEMGNSGEQTKGMAERLDLTLEFARKEKETYHIVLLLGGTNDLGFGQSFDHITSNLQTMYEAILSHSKNTRLIAMNIPETAHPAKAYNEKRGKINEWIKKFVSDNEESACFVDLESNFPNYTSEDEDFVNKHWDDGLHFTMAGYRAVAKLIYKSCLKDTIDSFLQD